MLRKAFAALAAAALLGAAAGSIHVTGQILAYQDGYVFFSTGDGFRVAPNVVIADAKTGGTTAATPAPRMYARAVFDASGTVTELDLSRRALPAEMDYAQVRKFAVALSTPAPNPDLAAKTPVARGGRTSTAGLTFSGKPVLVSFTVQVPPQTPLGATVYMTTDVSGWNAQAVQMQRTDALHFHITQFIKSGTVFDYLYTRGSLQSEELAENGLSRQPRELVVSDADVRAVNDTVFQWADLAVGSQLSQPNVMPTPFHNAPFPNLPPGQPTPHP